MDKDYKKEARRQYLRYFRIWIVIIMILAAACAGLAAVKAGGRSVERTNMDAPAERVYDYADVLKIGRAHV